MKLPIETTGVAGCRGWTIAQQQQQQMVTWFGT